MFIQFDDGLFRREFNLNYERTVIYDRDGDLIAITTNKGLLKSDLKHLFVGEFKLGEIGKIGDMYRVTVAQRSLLRAGTFSKGGTVVADPYPEPCNIISLTFHEKELTNKDARSKKLTWFLNQCMGREGYEGVAAQQALTKLESDGIVRVVNAGDRVTVERILWQEDE